MGVNLSDGLREQYDLGKGGQVYLWHVMRAAGLEAVVEAADRLRMEAGTVGANKMWVLREKYVAMLDALAALED